MADIANPHDRFFKAFMSRPDAARDFLERYLPPKVAALLDASSVELMPGSFVDPELREHHSDLLYSVKLKTGAGAHVYVLFEHKSHPDPLVAFQLLRYMVKIWDQTLRDGGALRPIVPIVVYHGLEAWQASPELHGLMDVPDDMKPLVPNYRYWLFDLSALPDAYLRSSAVLQTCLLSLKYFFREELWDRPPEIATLFRELRQATELECVEMVLRYLSQGRTRIAWRELKDAVEAKLTEEGGALVTSIAEEWLKEGEERGLQQGLQQGLLKGIEVGLELRFGAEGLRLLPEIQKIADVRVLEEIQKGLISAKTLAELESIYR